MIPTTAAMSFGDGNHGALGLPTSLMGLGVDAYEPTRVPSLPPDITGVTAGAFPLPGRHFRRSALGMGPRPRGPARPWRSFSESANTIEGKRVVHSFKNYTKLENVGAEHYYCRFEYKVATGAFTPDRVAMYCKSEMPYNPDDLMVQCEECKDWFHPACVNISNEVAKKWVYGSCKHL